MENNNKLITDEEERSKACSDFEKTWKEILNAYICDLSSFKCIDYTRKLWDAIVLNKTFKIEGDKIICSIESVKNSVRYLLAQIVLVNKYKISTFSGLIDIKTLKNEMILFYKDLKIAENYNIELEGKNKDNSLLFEIKKLQKAFLLNLYFIIHLIKSKENSFNKCDDIEELDDDIITNKGDNFFYEFFILSNDYLNPNFQDYFLKTMVFVVENLNFSATNKKGENKDLNKAFDKAENEISKKNIAEEHKKELICDVITWIIIISVFITPLVIAYNMKN